MSCHVAYGVDMVLGKSCEEPFTLDNIFFVVLQIRHKVKLTLIVNNLEYSKIAA